MLTVSALENRTSPPADPQAKGAPPQPPTKRTGLWVGLGVGAVVLLVAVAIAVMATGGSSTNKSSASSASSDSTLPYGCKSSTVQVGGQSVTSPDTDCVQEHVVAQECGISFSTVHGPGQTGTSPDGTSVTNTFTVDGSDQDAVFSFQPGSPPSDQTLTCPNGSTHTIPASQAAQWTGTTP